MPIPEFYRCVFPGLDVTLPWGRQNFRETLANEFPNEANGIDGFIDLVFDMADEAIRANILAGPPSAIDPVKFPRMAAYSDRTVAQVFDAFFSGQKIRSVLGQLCNFLGSRLPGCR